MPDIFSLFLLFSLPPQEIHEVFGDDKTRSITPEDLRHLEYLERVIKETLRMFPSIPQFGRKLSEDVTIPSGHTVRCSSLQFSDGAARCKLWPVKAVDSTAARLSRLDSS